MTEDNSHIKTPQNPDVKSAVGLIASFCWRVFVKMFSGLIYISLIVFPWVIEIIVATQVTETEKITTFVVCGSIQTVVSIYGAFKMGRALGPCCSKSKNEQEQQDQWDDIWGGSPTDYRSLFTAGYIIYWLPTWVITNMAISWNLLAY